jgi:hypothetical protein
MAIKDKPAFLPFTALTVAAIAWLRWPMPSVMVAGLLLSGGLAYWKLGRRDRRRTFPRIRLLAFVAFGGATACCRKCTASWSKTPLAGRHHLHPPLRHRPGGAGAECAGRHADRLGSRRAGRRAGGDAGHVSADERADLPADRPLGKLCRQALAEGDQHRRCAAGGRAGFFRGDADRAGGRLSAGRPGRW